MPPPPPPSVPTRARATFVILAPESGLQIEKSPARRAPIRRHLRAGASNCVWPAGAALLLLKREDDDEQEQGAELRKLRASSIKIEIEIRILANFFA